MKIVSAAEFDATPPDSGIDPETLATAQTIVDAVRQQGESAVRHYAQKFDERTADQPLFYDRTAMQQAIERIDPADIALLKRVQKRIADFAKAQMNCLSNLTVDVPGGTAGHTIQPVSRAGCYAPAGRFPLPSTVLMTAVTARVAGCQQVIVASPNPSDLMLATASIADADQFLAVGGAHAIAAMAFGIESDDVQQPPVDLICGPGNRFVTAAKKIVHGNVGIDMLAGPSELLLIADDTAAPATIAADLLAQAEHDTDARPFLVTPSRELAEQVIQQIAVQLETLPTAEIAKASLAATAAIITDSIDQAIEIANELAPEHLELHLADAADVATRIKNAGCIFIGHDSAEVFGDYGAGPNHTLPTAGTARFSAGLNVFTFLRIRTWLNLDQAPPELVSDTARLAELEGLIGHQRAGLKRDRG